MSSTETEGSRAETDDERADLVFRALASAQRRKILMMLATGAAEGDTRCCSGDEVCACVFAESLGLGAPTISHHMRVLADAGVVTLRKQGAWVFYRLCPDAFAPALRVFAPFLKGAPATCERKLDDVLTCLATQDGSLPAGE